MENKALIETMSNAQERTRQPAVDALRKTERAPDIVYLGAVAASMAISMLLLMRKRPNLSLFVGLWPVTIINLAMMLKSRKPSEEVEAMPDIGRMSSPVGAGNELMAE